MREEVGKLSWFFLPRLYFLEFKHLAQTVLKLWTAKVGSQKNPRLFGLRLHFLRFYIANCCSSDNSGSIPSRAKIQAPTTLLPFDQNKHEMPFLKALNSTKMEIRSQRARYVFQEHFSQVKVPQNHIIKRRAVSWREKK